MRNVVTIIAALALLSVPYTGTAKQTDKPPAALTAVENPMEDLRLRLNLTDDQTQAVLQVLQAYCAALRTILEKHSITAIVGGIRCRAIGGEPIYFMVDPGEFHVVRCKRDVAGGVLIGPPHLGAAWAAGGRSAASRSTRVPDSTGTGSAASALEKSREIVPQGLDGSLRLRGGTPAHAAVPSGLPEAWAPLRRTSTPFSAR